MVKFVKPERLLMRAHPELSERWVQDRIAEDPSILGIGDVVLRDRERIQPRAGRLDLLLQDIEAQRRYEVELQLGPTDESHIMRAIEYWDIERKRYPQYDHCAVLIAEDITSRFLNVIALFNGAIPFIALQMQALRFGDAVTLVFTRVVDELRRGPVDDEGTEPSTDRAYWEGRASKTTVGLADDLLALVRGFDPALALKYNKFYIGLSREGQPYNFVTFKPNKSRLNLGIALPKSDDIDARVNQSGIEELGYNSRSERYVLALSKADISAKADLIRDLMRLAYERRSA